MWAEVHLLLANQDDKYHKIWVSIIQKINLKWETNGEIGKHAIRVINLLK
jgi:hypothetical protein